MRFFLVLIAFVMVPACKSVQQDDEVLRFGNKSSYRYIESELSGKTIIAARANASLVGYYSVHGKQTVCQNALGVSDVSTVYDAPDAADERLENLVSMTLIEGEVAVEDEADIDYFVDATITDVPERLARTSPGTFCLLDLKSELYFRPFDQNGNRMRSIPGTGENIRRTEVQMFIAPDAVWGAIEDFIDEDVSKIAPTLRGEAQEKCGYFRSDPLEACQRLYRSKLREARHALECATNEDEKMRLEEELAQLEAEAPEIPPLPAPSANPGGIVIVWGAGSCPAKGQPELDQSEGGR